MSSIRFITKIQKNSDVRNGMYESPLEPSTGRTTWSRTAITAISPMLCVLPGIILGLANAAQKNATMMMTHRTAISSGLVTFHPPMLNSFWK